MTQSCFMIIPESVAKGLSVEVVCYRMVSWIDGWDGANGMLAHGMM